MSGPGRPARPRGSLWAVVCAALAALVTPARGAPPERFNDDILFVGMSPGSALEARALRIAGARVLHVHDAAKRDRIRAEADGKEHDVSTEQGARGFAGSLGLSPAQASAVAAALLGAGSDARDELARVAEAWARAERGGDAFSRLVISGHSAGSSFWGKGNGSLSLDALSALAAALPAAAARVEDVLLSGCHTGDEPAMGRLRAMFPALKTGWGYVGQAPDAYHGAVEHALRWERATRGRSNDLDPGAAAGTRKAEAVAVWSVQGGYRGKAPAAPGPRR